MYSVGSYVVYGEDGVCKIEKIAVPDFKGREEGMPYYFLRPVYYSGMIYAPLDTRVPMRPALTGEEALQLIDDMPEIVGEINDSRDQRLLNDFYKKMLQPHTSLALVQTIKSIYEKRKNGAGMRKLNATEERYLKNAEAQLYQELAFALQISPEDVERYIAQRLGDE